MSRDTAREIAWNLRTMGRIQATSVSDGVEQIYSVWIAGGRDANDNPVVANGTELTEAISELWKALTSDGAYVMIGKSKYVFNKGTWQQVLE